MYLGPNGQLGKSLNGTAVSEKSFAQALKNPPVHSINIDKDWLMAHRWYPTNPNSSAKCNHALTKLTQTLLQS